ncbi:MAG TPA: hypothetical protein VFB72_01795, partial [Verrucomicrobiae bacterium]|nr:hypothetical protein [Verrucomicrobiae bacterium]
MSKKNAKSRNRESEHATNKNSIHDQAGRLKNLASALEQESARWEGERQKISEAHEQRYPQEKYLHKELLRELNFMWENAVAAGRLLCELGETKVFDQQPRLKNAIIQVQSEMQKAQRDNNPPFDHVIVNLRYRSESNMRSYDVYYVKLFEIFCKVLAVS